MKHRLFSAVAALSAVLSALFLTSCHEDTIIKSSLTPAIDNIHTFGIGPDFGLDTITIRTRTVYADSVITSASNTGYPIYHALGVVNDPFAGRTTAGIYMQFSAPATGFSLGSNALDYVELVLPYAGFKWGDTVTGPGAFQYVNVYRITQSFSKDSTFYNFNNLATDATLVGTGSYTIGGVDDSVSVDGTNRAPHLRIRLTDAFRDFLKDQLTYDTSVTAFTDAFRGLAIMPDSTQSSGLAMAYFILNNSGGFYGSASLLAHVKLSGGGDTMYSFPYLEASNAHFNRITRSYNGYPAAALLNATADNSTMALMQNAPGAQIDVQLPYIQLLPKNVIINKAELVFRKIDTYSRFFAPSRVLPFGVNSSGGVYTVADRYPVTDATLNFIDGTPRLAAGGLTEYRINIPREVQRAIVQGSDGLHLRIGGTTNFPAAYRLLVGGAANGDKRYLPSVNIIYSKQ